MILFNHLLKACRYLNRYQLIKESCYSKSQLYEWLKHGVGERKARECKPVCESVVKAAAEVIGKYPHFSASKGQCYMIYHQLGYIPQHIYKKIKKIVHKLINRSVLKRGLLPPRTSYKHEHTRTPGQIWAEDFTEVRLGGRKIYIELVIDVAMPYYLGGSTSRRPDNEMIETPIEQALELTGGKGPELFLLSDNAKQYIGSRHRDFLEKHEIVQKRIPSCKPQYNGSIECGIKEFKNVFYNVWAQREKRGMAKEKPLLDRAQLAVTETLRRMNKEIPRPSLGGVTAHDVWRGIAHEKREDNRYYLEKELREKVVIRPWYEDNLGVVERQLFKEEFSKLELLTKFCFFLKKPLRQITKLIPKVLGN